MRMREGWEVWLLPNQATGKQGVPRYIKVDPATVSEASRGDGAQSGDTTKEVRTWGHVYIQDIFSLVLINRLPTLDSVTNSALGA